MRRPMVYQSRPRHDQLTSSVLLYDMAARMNVRRGSLRLWLFVSAIWLPSWGAYVWISRLDATEDATGRRVIAFHTGFGEGWRELKDFALGDYLNLTFIGIGIPLAVLILGYGVWWVAAGFRRNN
jgi:hypothetical protein